MMSIPFSKFHGFGNDYIVIERRDIPDAIDLGRLAISICARNTGAGADGIAVLERIESNDADYDCQIVNPDGSIAGFSGNGTRCAAAFLQHTSKWTEPGLRLRTRSGIKKYELIETDGSGYTFEAEIGRPHFASNTIPVTVDSVREAVMNEPMMIDGEQYLVSAVNVGNPVACIFVNEFEPEWRRIGRALEIHERFPERVNAVFVLIKDRSNIELRIWERGAGETAASGTCACGAAVLAAFLLKAERQVLVHSPGGTTDVHWRDDDEIVITGRAEYVYDGEWPDH